MNTVTLAYPALVTLAALAVYFWAAYLVGGARARFDVQPPRIDGPEGFQRVYRAHQNTLEQLVLFLPLLWLAALWFNPRYAAVLGGLWVVTRIWYIRAYGKASGQRLPPFLIGLVLVLLLFLAAAYGAVRAALLL